VDGHCRLSSPPAGVTAWGEVFTDEALTDKALTAEAQGLMTRHAQTSPSTSQPPSWGKGRTPGAIGK